jgi:hypothetical protein
VVYPNPVHDILNINGAAGHEITLFDMNGQAILTRKLCNDHETLDLSAMPFGNYLIKIGNKTLKITK